MLLSVSHLTVRRNQNVLLNNVSFDAAEGEYLTIIGPNGAGKSTLLKCLDRILADWTGNIALNGTPVREVSRKELSRKMAYVQQSVPSGFSFTVQQLVEMGRYPHLKPLSPLSEEDEIVTDEAMEKMNIRHLANRFAETLSGGEMQKVHIAAALAQQADILLLDEPTTYLDYKHQSEIGQILRTLNQKHGKTIIEVTHDVNRAVLDATHVIALTSGSVVFDGTPQYLMEPVHLRSIYGIDFQLVNHPALPLKLVVPGV
ncbi:MAG: ABC transporter ATP-binding protein [Planctomycetaceae bacterium]|jgi:iron complex transport system ATP-binding protein|nr:ABC transporter ATP-binding protein [Planctomycetaceae bacterium]